MSGQKLDATQMGAFIALQQNSFIPDPVVLRQQIPPPSPPPPPLSVPGEPTMSTNYDPWSISVEDLTPTLPQPPQPTVDKGMLLQI